ncbi:MAG: hypothetical protein JST54_17880 [Deltaproteobacteria bacterium]|nr:hypothetical protein [Deltaproteobacteria bacterium]
MNRKLLLAALVASLSGCAANINGHAYNFNPIADSKKQDDDRNQRIAQQQEKRDQETRDAKAKQDAQAREAQRKQDEDKRKQEAAAREEQRKKDAAAAKVKADELAAKAKTTQVVRLEELGVELQVPGDVKVERHDSDDYGSPGYMLTGDASNFSLIVTDASKDRFGLHERIRAEQTEFRFGIDVLSMKEGKGGWSFLYSDPIYYNDGSRGGTEYGQWSRVSVGKQKLNCLIAGLSSQNELNRALDACQAIKAAKVVASK